MTGGGGVRTTVLTGVTASFTVTLCMMVIVSLLASCGRRGDPVLPSSYEEKTPPAGEMESAPPGDREIPPAGTVRKETEKAPSPPEAPQGLTAVFTGKSVVLTWNELRNQGVKFYRIYRSSGSGYEAVAETVTTAYTDRNVKETVEYYYRVSAVGASEGPLSEPIKVSTELQ
jgi:hypothetical protein